MGGRIQHGNADTQCATGYRGVRCEVCDYENDYAMNEIGDRCSKCKPDEGIDSIYIASGVVCGLVLLFVITKLRLWPRWLRTRLSALDLRESYLLRISKLKITIQFVDICCQIPNTYRLSLPRSSAKLLSSIKIPISIDCFSYVLRGRPFSYIDHVYASTLSCLIVRLLMRDDFLLFFCYTVYGLLCTHCLDYFLCLDFEDGESYLAIDVSIKCKGPEAGPHEDALIYVSFMSALFLLGTPLAFLLALLRTHAINPPLQAIMKDRDYVSSFALCGRRFVDAQGEALRGQRLTAARDETKRKWIKNHPDLAVSLEGKDYRAQFERKQARSGWKRAEDLMKRKARAVSLPAQKTRFLWHSYRVRCWAFEVVDTFRRLLVLALPKFLRALSMPYTVIQLVGLFVMTLSPVLYSLVDPFEDRTDHFLMVSTQLVEIVLLLCGLLRETMNEEQLIDWVVQVAIFATVCPMLLALLYYVWRPGGRIVRGMVVTNKEDQARQQANRLLVQLLNDHRDLEAKKICKKITAVEEGDIDSMDDLSFELQAALKEPLASLERMKAKNGHLLQQRQIGELRQETELRNTAGPLPLDEVRSQLERINCARPDGPAPLAADQITTQLEHIDVLSQESFAHHGGRTCTPIENLFSSAGDEVIERPWVERSSALVPGAAGIDSQTHDHAVEGCSSEVPIDDGLHADYRLAGNAPLAAHQITTQLKHIQGAPEAKTEAGVDLSNSFTHDGVVQFIDSAMREAFDERDLYREEVGKHTEDT
eukprot:g497.t1